MESRQPETPTPVVDPSEIPPDAMEFFARIFKRREERLRREQEARQAENRE